MKIKTVLIQIVTLILWNFVKCEDKSVILSTKEVAQLNSNKLLDPLRKYEEDIYIIASVNVEGEKSGLQLNKDQFNELELTNYVNYQEDCDKLHDLLNNTFERIGFDFIDRLELVPQVESGLWFYLPVLDSESLKVFKELKNKYKDTKNFTLLVTDCDLLRSKQSLKDKDSKEQKEEKGIRVTPVILQQICVVLFFLLILAFGLYISMKVKTPSSLLTPQAVKSKVS